MKRTFTEERTFEHFQDRLIRTHKNGNDDVDMSGFTKLLLLATGRTMPCCACSRCRNGQCCLCPNSERRLNNEYNTDLNGP